MKGGADPVYEIIGFLNIRKVKLNYKNTAIIK